MPSELDQGRERRTGSAMVLAQYYNLVRFGRKGYTLLIDGMHENAKLLADRLRELGGFDLVGDGEEQLPLVAFNLEGERSFDEFDIAWQVSAERGWMLPAYTMPPNADHVKMLRALVKLDLSHSMVTTLADDLATACETLEKKGGAHAAERQQVKTGTGY
jgi:glutamate decarboxylase